MSSLRIRAPRLLLIIGVLALLPLIAIASPSNAAPITTAHTPHAITGPVHGKHLVHRTTTHGIPGANGGSSTTTSDNWSGYTVVNSVNTNTNSFNKVSATWTEPAVTCDPNQPNNEMAVFWVGLDGWLNGNVEQGGTEAECLSGSPIYFAWWEMYPYNGIDAEFTINAGDVIHSTVTYDPSTSQFDIVVNDETSNQTLSQDIACQPTEPACDRSSAEVISEDPGGGVDYDDRFPLPDYGTQTFTDASVTDVNGHTGSLNDPAWNNVAINQVSTAGVLKQTVGPLSPDGTSFSTTWQAELGGPTSLMSNAGFETGNFLQWSCLPDDDVVTSPVHSGAYAAQITPTASNTGECDQFVTLSPDTSYTLTGWVQGTGATLGVSDGATASQSVSSSGWTQLTVPFTTGSSGDVTVYIHGRSGAGNVYADDLALTG